MPVLTIINELEVNSESDWKPKNLNEIISEKYYYGQMLKTLRHG